MLQNDCSTVLFVKKDFIPNAFTLIHTILEISSCTVSLLIQNCAIIYILFFLVFFEKHSK